MGFRTRAKRAFRILRRRTATAPWAQSQKTRRPSSLKHSKFEERGKRRLHQKPKQSEIKACRPWLDEERTAEREAFAADLGVVARALAG